MLVFETVRMLVNEGVEIYIVCSGRLEGYRDISHIKCIKEFITENKLEENIRLLDFMEYEDISSLINFIRLLLIHHFLKAGALLLKRAKVLTRI